MKSLSTQRGLTLIEIVVVCAVISVMAGLAAPSLKTLRNNMASKEATLQVRSLMRKGQSRAVTNSKYHVLAIRLRASSTVQDQATLFEVATPSTIVATNGLTLNHLKGVTAAPAPLTFIQRADIPVAVGFGPPGGSATVIETPYPFNGIPRTAQCTFCAGTEGAMHFDPQGQISFTPGTTAVQTTPNGSLTIAPLADWATPTEAKLIYTITAMGLTGATRVWQPR